MLQVGLIWLDEGSDPNNGQDVQAVGGVLFFSVIHNMFNPVFPIAQTFPVSAVSALIRNVFNPVLTHRSRYPCWPHPQARQVVHVARCKLAVMASHTMKARFGIGVTVKGGCILQMKSTHNASTQAGLS